MSNRLIDRLLGLTLLALVAAPAWSRADDDDDRTPATAPAQSPMQPGDTGDTQFGLFGLLDKRSKYYSDFFPEPLRVEDTTADNELKLNWLHDEGKTESSNQFIAEVQIITSLVFEF